MSNEEQVAQLLHSTLTSIFNSDVSVEAIGKLLEKPKDSALGDVAFPCFQLAKVARKAPNVIATEVAQALQNAIKDLPTIEKVLATGPYVNFFLSRASLAADIIPAVLSGEFINRRTAKNEKVMVEYASVNTHKSVHVGHLRNASLGDTIARLYDWSGYETIRSFYLGDEGTHVAKCLWYLNKYQGGKVPESGRLEFLGEMYSKATLQLDPESYTTMPIRGVVTAKVKSIEAHPAEPLWLVITVDSKDGVQTVVTQKKNATQISVGDLIPHATPGTTIGSRALGVADKKGVVSHGLLAGLNELGLGDLDQIPVLTVSQETEALYGTDIGVDVAELYRIPSEIPSSVKIFDQLKSWTSEVSEVLRGLEGGSSELTELWKQTRQWSIDEIRDSFRWINCEADHIFFESQFGESSKEVVREYQKKGIFIESQGAVGADLTKDKLGFCVLIKRDGTALYATRDLELAKKKFDQFKIDRSIYVVDAAQTLHFQQVFKCLELMGYEQVKNCFHCSYAQVVLPDGKMSSRKGNVILMSALKERLLSKIHSEFLAKYEGDWPKEELTTAAHRIALATMRYGMLNQDNNSMIVFDLEGWTSRTGNTGPYMMYAYARTRSILRELGNKNFDFGGADWSLLTHETESEVLRHLSEYEKVVLSTAARYSPHILCGYVYELSKLFSRMYKHCSVLHAESEELQVARAGLADATGRVIRHGLSLLGIETVERM